MADFAMWAEACTMAYWKPGTFLTAYRENLAGAVELVLDASTVAGAVRSFMAQQTKWEGMASELLKVLSALIGEQAAKGRTWPKTANVLSNRLRRVAPPLRKVGIQVTFDREGHGGTKKIRIETRAQPEQEGKTSSASSASSAKDIKSSKINGKGAADADDTDRNADDADDGADDEVAGIVSTKPLKNNDATTDMPRQVA
jgi:hypothetical protein